MKIGIDFGTTNCTIGRLRTDGARFLISPIPSLGTWSNGEFTFGTEAREKLRTGDRTVHLVRDLKLRLGQDGVLVFGKERVAIEDAAKALFRYLVSHISRNEDVDEAVIATPVEASRNHRVSLQSAAEAAGIGNVRLVYEPTAALIGSKRFQGHSSHDQVLIVDWGGGTLDIAVIQTDGMRYEELVVGGDFNRLGGTRIDEVIARIVMDRNPNVKEMVVKTEGGFERLKDEVEEIKLEYLESLDGEDSDPIEVAPAWLRSRFSIEPKLVFRVIRDFSNKAVKQILEKLREGNVDRERVTHVLFAGGMCKSSIVREEVMGYFPHALEISQSVSGQPVDRQALTGAGCTDVTARDLHVSLGASVAVRQCDDALCVLLKKGLSLAVESYRKADFLVVDPEAREAVLDIGLLMDREENVQDMLDHRSEAFLSLNQLYVPVGHHSPNRMPVSDTVNLAIGIERTLTLRIVAQSQMAVNHRENFLSGVPLVLQLS